jgi:hypothetical protein
LETIQLYQLVGREKEPYPDFLHRIGLTEQVEKPKELTDKQKSKQLEILTVMLGGEVK